MPSNCVYTHAHTDTHAHETWSIWVESLEALMESLHWRHWPCWKMCGVRWVVVVICSGVSCPPLICSLHGSQSYVRTCSSSSLPLAEYAPRASECRGTKCKLVSLASKAPVVWFLPDTQFHLAPLLSLSEPQLPSHRWSNWRFFLARQHVPLLWSFVPVYTLSAQAPLQSPARLASFT